MLRADSVTGTWTGALYGNGAFVTMTADVDLANPAFYSGGWWFSQGVFSNMTVTVTGSATPAFNGTFTTGDFNWLRIYSNAATSSLALTVPYSIDLGNGGSSAPVPTDAGSPGVMQVGSGFGEFVSWNGPLAAPEPGTMAFVGLSILALVVARRRR